MKEEWKDITGYEGLYMVSNMGQVKSLEKNITKVMYGGGLHSYTRMERILKPELVDGYQQVTLCKNNKKRFKVHRLVAAAFIPNPDNKPMVNHKKGIRNDNRAGELEWSTGSENCLHAYKELGRTATGGSLKGEANPSSKLIDSDVLFIRINTHLSQRFLAVKYGVSKTAIKFIRQNKSWQHVSIT